MLEKSDRLRLHQLIDHVAEHRADSVESLVGVAYIGQAGLVEEDLLNYEDGDGLRKLRTSFHDAEAEWDDLCGKKEMYDRVVVVLLGTTSQKWMGEEA